MIKQNRISAMTISFAFAAVLVLSNSAHADSQDPRQWDPAEIQLTTLHHMAQRVVDPWEQGPIFLGQLNADGECEELPTDIVENARHLFGHFGVWQVHPHVRALTTQDAVRDRADVDGSDGWILCVSHPDQIHAIRVDEVVVETTVASNDVTIRRAYRLERENRRWTVIAPFDPERRFGARSNLIICFAAMMLGLPWLLPGVFVDTEAVRPWRSRCYRIWWLSLLFWLVAWLLIYTGLDRETHVKQQIAILLLDNANTSLLLVLYFAVSRGREFNWANIIRTGSAVASTVGLFLVALYLVFYLGFKELALSITLHQTWSLCFAVLAMTILGWGFRLRFGSNAVFLVAVTYGFLQPLIYATEISSLESSRLIAILSGLRPVVSMVLAFMKVVLAVVVLAVLHRAQSSESTDFAVLGRERTERDNTVGAEIMRMRKCFDGHSSAYAASLFGVYLILLVWLGAAYQHFLVPLSIGLTIVVGFMAILQGLWAMWNTLTES